MGLGCSEREDELVAPKAVHKMKLVAMCSARGFGARPGSVERDALDFDLALNSPCDSSAVMFGGSKRQEPLLGEDIESFSEGSSEIESTKCCSNCPGGIKVWKWTLTILSIFCAPLAMAIVTKECGFTVILSCLLYIFGWLGSVIHALIVIWGSKTVDRNYTAAK